MDRIAASAPIEIYADLGCVGCARPHAIATDINRARSRWPLSAIDIEHIAQAACGKCLDEVRCGREDGAWTLELARAEAQAAA